MKKIVLIILACLFFASVLAFLANYLIYTPMMASNAAMIDNQYNEIARLTQFSNDLRQTLATQEFMLSSQQAEIANLKEEINTQQASISALEKEKSELENALSECEKRSG